MRAAATQTKIMKYLQSGAAGGRADSGITHLAFRWVTRVRSGQQTARNRSMEMADRVRMLEIMHKTETQSSVRIFKQTNAENNQTRKSR